MFLWWDAWPSSWRSFLVQICTSRLQPRRLQPDIQHVIIKIIIYSACCFQPCLWPPVAMLEAVVAALHRLQILFPLTNPLGACVPSTTRAAIGLKTSANVCIFSPAGVSVRWRSSSDPRGLIPFIAKPTALWHPLRHGLCQHRQSPSSAHHSFFSSSGSHQGQSQWVSTGQWCRHSGALRLEAYGNV